MPTDDLPQDDDRHLNPSGLPDEGIVHEYDGKTVHIPKAPAPLVEEHHEEGHEDPPE